MKSFRASFLVRFSLDAGVAQLEEFLMYEIRRVRDHIEVFLNGEFQFSADNMKEVEEELDGSI